MFFEQERSQFFRPLTSKYREQMVECLRELYKQLYSSSHAGSAEYGQALSRDTMINIFSEALVRAPVMQSEEEDEEGRFKTHRELAAWLLNTLLEHGWIEKQVDEATLQSSFSFSRWGRHFVEPFLEGKQTQQVARHRNTRNTRNALESFLEHGEVYDLLDAYEYSERIISDFTDVISELDERKRALVREMEGQMLVQKASDQFFDFMEKRFQPDLAVRLSADNVEKYRDQISQLVEQIKASPKSVKAKAEKRLRELLPEQVQGSQSLLWSVLDDIEHRLKSACEHVLPLVRKSLQNFTKRADIIIRQMSYLASQKHNDVVSVCKHLSSLPADEQNAQLEHVSSMMAVPQLRFIDPSQVRLQAPRKRTVIDDGVDEGLESVDQGSRRELYVQQALDQAFFVNNNQVRRFMIEQFTQRDEITSSEIPVNNAADLLAIAHVVSVGAVDNLSSEYQFELNWVDQKSDEYFEQKDVFSIRLIKKEHAAA
ncbi:MAG: flagellar protein FliT [Bermanella sp.]|nr:flagellar protein FliT [Bermanella sp.]|tara:strand:- start:934 stop:2388 length:1455 start_codon:yes stop_codon:yes gene_type:complete